MRIGLLVVGIIFVIAGLWITIDGASFGTTKTDAKLGPIKVQHEESHAVPQWIGIAGIVIGGLLVVGGVASKKR